MKAFITWVLFQLVLISYSLSFLSNGLRWEFVLIWNRFGVRGRLVGQLQRPVGVVVLGNGNIAIADYDNKWISIFDPTGKFMSRIGHGKLLGMSISFSFSVPVIPFSWDRFSKFTDFFSDRSKGAYRRCQWPYLCRRQQRLCHSHFPTQWKACS